MSINSRQKGARGERQFRDVLREHGFCKSFRTQQYCGAGPNSSDVTCPEIPSVHWEVKNVEAGNPYVWMEQAIRDSRRTVTEPVYNEEGLMTGQVTFDKSHTPIVAHKRNGREWLAVMRMEDLLALLKETDRCQTVTTDAE